MMIRYNSNKKTLLQALLIFSGLLCFHYANAQGNWNDIQEQIRSNNPELKWIGLLHQSNTLKYKTGLTPPGLEAEYESIGGKSRENLYQKDLLIKQSFAFPVAYIRKKQLAAEQIHQSELNAVALSREIMHEARLTYISIVYYTKLKNHLTSVRNNYENILAVLTKQMNSGDGTILDVNKARLQLLEVNEQLSACEQMLQKKTIHLRELNGGKDIPVVPSEYEELELLPEFEKLESEIEAADPHLKMIRQEQAIAGTQIRLERSQSLPQLSLGYRYQSVPGYDFNGFHTGITIPLWENKNRIRYRKAELAQYDQELETHLNEHFHSIRQLYDQYESLRNRIALMRSVLTTIESPVLLKKALDSGHLTLAQYYLDLNLYLQAQIKLFDSEKAYQETMAELTKHRL